MEPGARRSRREERSEETRAELVAAAVRLFAERGFRAASLAQIAASAGYTTGAIYFHFGGKEELFLAAYESYALTRVEEVSAAFEGARGGLPERARAVADHWMARQERDPSFALATLEFFVLAMRRPALREALAARQAAVRMAAGRLVAERAREEGVELPLPAEDTATVLRELGIGMSLARLLDPEAIPERLYGDFVESYYRLAADRGRERVGGG